MPKYNLSQSVWVKYPYLTDPVNGEYYSVLGTIVKTNSATYSVVASGSGHSMLDVPEDCITKHLHVHDNPYEIA